MRTRRLLAGGAATLAVAALSLDATAQARPGHHQPRAHLTIHAQPNPDVTGDPVVVFGRLAGPDRSGRTVTLWHHVVGSPRGFTPVTRTVTDSNGFYDFQRAEGVVRTNRDWFVRAAGVRSRIVRERVQAEVTLQAPATGMTDKPIHFSGHVTPDHVGEPIVLQRQVAPNGNEWRRIGVGRIGAGSNFDIPLRLRVPDDYTVRAVFRGDRRNLPATSASVDVVVSQAQNPRLQLNASPDPIVVGQSVTLSGVLDVPNPGGQTVTLYARQHGQSLGPVATAVTQPDGTFSFDQTPTHNTVYEVRSDGQVSRQVFEAVEDAITISAQPTNPASGQAVTFSGTVVPDKAGDEIELQRLGDDGRFHVVRFGTVDSASNYSIRYVVRSPGQQTFRVQMNGGPFNAGGDSSPVTITVGPQPPAA